MGRLFQWIRSSAASRGDARRSAAVSRRRLAFERCESRIALSTADGDLTEVTLDHGDQSLMIDDGGSIALTFAADGFLNWSAVKHQLDSIVVGKVANFTIRTEPLIALQAGTADLAIRQFQGNVISYGNLASDRAVSGNLDLSVSGTLAPAGVVDKAFDYFDSRSQDDYGMSLNGPESSSPSINSDLSVIPTPLPLPSEQPDGHQDNEGGQIALTPFVAPTGLTLSDGYGASSIARAKHQLEELRETPGSRTGETGRVEGLRGRAVVYEVADAGAAIAPTDEQPTDGEPVVDGEAIQLASLNEFAPDNSARGAQRTAKPLEVSVDLTATVAESVVADAAPIEADFTGLQAPGKLSLNGDDADELSLNGSAGDRDEAFAAWTATEASEQPGDAPESPHGDRDRRMIGIGLATVLSFVPLRKALRRRGEQTSQRELPRRRLS